MKDKSTCCAISGWSPWAQQYSNYWYRH